MRSEQEMLDLIMKTAIEDDRIRAVIMNGSRANPNAPKDIFQDFDIVYGVTNVTPFRKNLEWIRRFGELMILQMPDDMGDPPLKDEGFFAYLMQFADGNRIDLGIFPVNKIHEKINDSLGLLLLDKDGTIAPFPPPSERDYLPIPPTKKAYMDCCNEFWWVSTYVAKGLWRQEILYAKYMLDQVMREELMKMLKWYIGTQTEFLENPGKFGKYFQRYLEPDLWIMLQKTFADAGSENTWAALFMMGDLFRTVALPVANQFGFDYPHKDDRKVTAHLHHIHQLPKDAKEIY